MSNLTQFNLINDADTMLASVMVVLGAFGLPANIISCYCFIKISKPNEMNSNYFKYIYIAITCVDGLICLGQLPVIENLMTERQGAMFAKSSVCGGWVFLWRSLIMTSIWLVGQISISRLVLFVRPRMQFSSYLNYLPVIVFLGVLAVLSGALAGQYISICNFPTITATCITLGYQKGFSYIEAFILPIPLPRAVLKSDIINNLLQSCFLGFPFIPICISFITSVIYLNRSKKRAKQKFLNASKMHLHAQNTIIFVTLMYLICNIPSVLFLVIRAYRIIQVGKSGGEMTLHQIHRIVNPTYIEKFYFRMSVEVLSVVLNSALNPVVYMWRMKAFRDFVLRRTLK